jgi:hypothetical protein
MPTLAFEQTSVTRTTVGGAHGRGRPATIDAAQVRAMKAQGLGASEIAKALNIGRASEFFDDHCGSRSCPRNRARRDKGLGLDCRIASNAS